jgi:hypothetical protein
MARVTQNHPLYGASGRIGNLLTYNLKGIQVVKTLPVSDKKKRKFSVLQEKHLYSFKAQCLFAQSLKETIIDRVWAHLSFTGGINPYNFFIQCNRAAFGGEERIVFPELLVISHGRLIPAAKFKASREGENIVFTWVNTEAANVSPKDKINIVLLKNREEIVIAEVNATREQETTSVSVAGLTGTMIEGYSFWSTKDDQLFSPSIYWTC